MAKVNHGDTLYIQLDYTLDGLPLHEYIWDDIEFMFGTYRYTLLQGTIVYDNEVGNYCVSISQQQTFASPDIVEYQIRLYKDNEVVSSKVGRMPLGKVLSTTKLGEALQ